MSSFHKGVLSAVIAQVLWGLFPFYWKWLDHVNSIEILSHRTLWCAVFLSVLVVFTAERRAIVRRVLSSKAEIGQHFISSSLIAANWLVYIWAVNNNHVIDASLGYFLSPLVSVVLGFLVFSERLNVFQWSAVILAALGVVIMTVASGVFPWIGLALAFSFGIYGMARKKASTGPINGLFVETLLLVPVSLLALLWLFDTGDLTYKISLNQTDMLLVLGGLVTAIPLVLYAQGARSLPLSFSGLLVFITPSIQFLIGWRFFKEPILLASWFGFACIWLALVLYSFALAKIEG
ncbi:MAG: chloramphenicol-sensitive protein RarD [Granulosicoccus sp.]|jgi:chloramphenicol-sensitive protein RarD